MYIYTYLWKYEAQIYIYDWRVVDIGEKLDWRRGWTRIWKFLNRKIFGIDAENAIEINEFYYIVIKRKIVGSKFLAFLKISIRKIRRVENL